VIIQAPGSGGLLDIQGRHEPQGFDLFGYRRIRTADLPKVGEHSELRYSNPAMHGRWQTLLVLKPSSVSKGNPRVRHEITFGSDGDKVLHLTPERGGTLDA